MPLQTDKKITYYRSLALYMVLTIIAVSFVPVFLVSSTIYYQFNQSYRKKVNDHLLELVERHKKQIDGFLNERLADVRFLSKSFGFDRLSDEAFLEQKLYLLQQQYGHVFVDLGVIDSSGDQIAYAGPFKLGKARYADAEWFHEAMDDGLVISDVFLGLRQLPHFIVAARNDTDGGFWILRATVDFVAFSNLVKNIRIGETGFAFILNKEGEFQTQPVFDFRPTSDCYGYFVECAEAALKDINIEERSDESGIMTIYVTALLKDRDWLLVYKQHKSDAFSELIRAERFAILIFILGGIGIVTMALLLSRRMVGKIFMSDREKAIMNKQVVESGKLASLGELAAGVAHEINNPVAVIIEEAGWITDILSRSDIQDPNNLKEIQRVMEKIHDQGMRCGEITKKLLSFARGTDSRIRDLDINEAVDDVVGLTAQRAKYANVEIRKNLKETLPKIQASETEMQQVLMNMINNAIYAMEKTGGVIEVKTDLEKGHLLIQVADTGPGIPKANLERIFDPFYTTKPVGRGTGLGLSICYGIITKMEGNIEVESTVGLGTTFTVRLPFRKVSD
jgi:two-component system NtrC family sensor kinase